MPDINAQFNVPVGIEGPLTVPFGMTGGTGIRVTTYPDGLTTQRADRGQYFWSFISSYMSGSGLALRANRTYFTPNTAEKNTTIKSLRFMSANTSITGDCYFSVWTSDINTGNPDRRLYVSSSVPVGSGYNYTTVTNASGLVTVPAGNFWIGVSFSSTPTVYALHKDYIMPYMGGTDPDSGYRLYYPMIDATGFTAPTSITGTGLTFSWLEYTPSTYIIPRFTWQST